jgi:pimeloyl-ACP methyl ester carboxylesterase
MKTVKHILFPLFFIAVGSVGGLALFISAAKKMNSDANWYSASIGIDRSYSLQLAGTQQHLRIRGQDRNNPVLLDLHGGPGASFMGMTHRNYKALTEYFTVVEWDQPGAGLSAFENADRISFEFMVDNAIKLIQHIQQEYKTDKVLLVGHSWGSMLGLGVINKRPDLVSAYVGVGQALAWNKGFDETQRLLLKAAKNNNDTQTIESLSQLPTQWPARENIDATLERINTIQAPLTEYKGALYASKSNNIYNSNMVLDIATSPDISFANGLAMLCLSDASRELMKDLYNKDLREEIGYVFEVPIFIFQGQHDWQTPTTLVKPWFEKITAPHKSYIPFNNSAHMVFTEEPGKYLIEMVTKVRPFSLAN